MNPQSEEIGIGIGTVRELAIVTKKGLEVARGRGLGLQTAKSESVEITGSVTGKIGIVIGIGKSPEAGTEIETEGEGGTFFGFGFDSGLARVCLVWVGSV